MNPKSPTARESDAARAPEKGDGGRRRRRLDRERVLSAAVELADRIGVAPLTMRRLAQHLGVRPMSLYHHVEDKAAILDGMVDRVFAEMALPPEHLGWKEAMRVRCLSARLTLVHHPWAVPLLDSRRSPGPATLRQHDAVIGCLRRGGLSNALTAHAYAVLDSFVYGFVLQEASLPFSDGAELVSQAQSLLASPPGEELPSLRAFTGEHVLQPGYAFAHSFEFGLDLILDALEAAADGPR